MRVSRMVSIVMSLGLSYSLVLDGAVGVRLGVEGGILECWGG